MGCFSWLKADNLTNVANIVYGASFKFLVPKEFGGGFIKDHYQDYGRLATKDDGTYKYDMYELLAFWNANMPYADGLVRDYLHWDNEFPLMKEVDSYTKANRVIGINIGHSKSNVDKLIFPLKLVSPSYKGSYEDLCGKSYIDPNQGLGKLYRSKLVSH